MHSFRLLEVQLLTIKCIATRYVVVGIHTLFRIRTVFILQIRETVMQWVIFVAALVIPRLVGALGPPFIDCSVVLCAEPLCDNPIPPEPGQCCPRCPGICTTI